MPSAPPTICNRPSCPGKVQAGVCSVCGPKRRQRDYDRNRGTSTERGYDYQWQQFRKRYLAANPLCLDCKETGIIAAARDIHHKQKLCDHPELKYEEENLLPLCKMHHDKRTARGE